MRDLAKSKTLIRNISRETLAKRGINLYTDVDYYEVMDSFSLQKYELLHIGSQESHELNLNRSKKEFDYKIVSFCNNHILNPFEKEIIFLYQKNTKRIIFLQIGCLFGSFELMVYLQKKSYYDSPLAYEMFFKNSLLKCLKNMYPHKRKGYFEAIANAVQNEIFKDRDYKNQKKLIF